MKGPKTGGEGASRHEEAEQAVGKARRASTKVDALGREKRLQIELNKLDVLSKKLAQLKMGKEIPPTKSIDEEISELQAIVESTLGGRPVKRRGLSSMTHVKLPKDATDAQVMAKFMSDRFRTGMRTYISVSKLLEEGYAEIDAVSSQINGLGNKKPLTLKADEKITQVLEQCAEIQASLHELVAGDPEIFIGSNLRKLKGYRRDLADVERGKIAITPSVEVQLREVIRAIDTGKPLFLHGDLGSGKTALLKLASKIYLQERAAREGTEGTASTVAEIVSGSSNTDETAFLGANGLTLKETEKTKLYTELNAADIAFEDWKRSQVLAHRHLTPSDMHNMQKAFYEAAGKNASGTVTSFVLGPLYTAMKEGRPFIIDEMNMMPHGALTKLNDMLMMRPGDTVAVEGSEKGEVIKIKQGFVIVATGNLPSPDSNTYVGRKDLDAAFLSRFTLVSKEYLPQSNVNNFEDASPEDRKGSELFHMLLAKIMDNNGNINVPPGEIGKLWKLAVFARRTQEIFLGVSGDGTMRAALDKSVLSLRGVVPIIDSWVNKSTGSMRYELDHYIIDFINSAPKPESKAALYEIAQSIGLFPTKALKGNWPEGPDASASAGKVAPFNIKSPGNRAKPPEHGDASKTVETAFGSPPPRTEFPEFNAGNAEGVASSLEVIVGYKKAGADIERELKEIADELARRQSGGTAS